MQIIKIHSSDCITKSTNKPQGRLGGCEPQNNLPFAQSRIEENIVSSLTRKCIFFLQNVSYKLVLV